jgi:hypothetical protein
MPAANEKAWFVLGSGRRFDERFIKPKRLGFDEIDPMFGFVGRTFLGIELELHTLSVSLEERA